MPGPPLPCSSLRRPPSDACRLHSAAPAPPASVPPRSRLCFVWPAPTWPAELSLLAFSLCASLVPCDTSSPTPRQRWPPTVPRRPCARAGYEMQTKAIPTSAPGDYAPTSEEPAPIKMTNQQLDTPVHDGHCTHPLLSLSPLGPLCTKRRRIAPRTRGMRPQYTRIPLFRLKPVSRYPCPETRVTKPVSRNPVSYIYTMGASSRNVQNSMSSIYPSRGLNRLRAGVIRL